LVDILLTIVLAVVLIFGVVNMTLSFIVSSPLSSQITTTFLCLLKCPSSYLQLPNVNMVTNLFEK
jgi:hypothetical protein